MGSHLKEDATIRGALKELIEENGWIEVITTLDLLFSRPDNFDHEASLEAESVQVPMGVNIVFPRRRTLAEEGDYSKVYSNKN